MDSVLEQIRYGHEECERLENAIADALVHHPNRKRKDEVNRDHKCKEWLDRLRERSKRLCVAYEDKDGALKKEITCISGGDKISGRDW